MKKISALVITMIVSLVSLNAVAQDNVEAGQWMIGATGGLNIEENNHVFTIAPYGEYIIADQFGVGVQLNCNILGYGNGADSRFGFGAFASYYLPIVQNFYFKPMLEVNFLFDHGTHFEIAAVPAFQYFAWEKMSFLIKAGGLSYGDFGNFNDKRIRLNIANQVTLGLAYSF